MNSRDFFHFGFLFFDCRFVSHDWIIVLSWKIRKYRVPLLSMLCEHGGDWLAGNLTDGDWPERVCYGAAAEKLSCYKMVCAEVRGGNASPIGCVAGD